MSEQEFLQAGIAAIKSGDRQRASTILAQLIKEHPQSEKGWYLLGMCVPNDEQRQYCFRRVLTINPNNVDAKKQLALLSKPQPFDKTQGRPAPPPPAWTPPAQRVEPALPPKTPAAEQAPRSVSPFVSYDSEQEATENPVSESAHPSTSSSQNNVQKAATAKKKKDNRILLVAAFAGVLTLVCASIAVFFMLNGSFGRPASPAPQNQIPTATIPPLAATATNTLAPPTQRPTPLPTVAYIPFYEEAPCQFETPGRVKVTCGYVTVPENRTGDPSHTIQLAVAVFHSTSSNPAPDPVVFLQGGPGGAAVEMSASAYQYLVQPFISERDYITFDQRGTGLSDPALKCDELDKVYRQDIYGMLDLETREYVYKNALLSCNGLLRANNIQLNAYSTVESAADLRDIVKLLGYEKVNLYGASYGTRLALVTMRNHPEIVRSAILDSVVPVEANVLHGYPASVDSALSKLFDTCVASPECNSAYPDLETVFWDLVNDLDNRPITLSTSAYPMGTVTETVDGYYLMSVVLGLEKVSYFINSVPQTIYRVKERDYSTLIAAQYSLPYAFDGINPGLYVSMMCREHVLATTEEELQAASEQVDANSVVWRPFYGNFGEMFKACKSWGADGPDLGENDAVVSDIPSLVIAGAYDSATPPFYGKQVAENLANSFYFEFPNMGHVPTSSDSCAMQVALDFIESPIIEPERTCLNEIQEVKFLVPYTGEPAVELKKKSTFGVTVNAPQDWYYDSGFFVRYSSPFDITQVGAFRALISVQELKDYFSSSAYGYRGLDSAPVETGMREANGLTWKLYSSASNARPVDIAAAEKGGSSIIIIMFSHPDEHDALYRTVFLPMVDSAR